MSSVWVPVCAMLYVRLLTDSLKPAYYAKAARTCILLLLLQGMLFWSFNGLGLSLLVPNAQSLIADYYPAHQRGEAFGVLYLTGQYGHHRLIMQ
jgi:MFS family permease